MREERAAADEKNLQEEAVLRLRNYFRCLQSIYLALAKKIMAHKPFVAAVVIKQFGASQVEASPTRGPYGGSVCAIPARRANN